MSTIDATGPGFGYDNGFDFSSGSSDLFGSSSDLFGSSSELSGTVSHLSDLSGSSSDLFGTGPDLFGSTSNLFGTSSDLFGSPSNLFGSASDLFGSSSNLLGSTPSLFADAGAAFAPSSPGSDKSDRNLMMWGGALGGVATALGYAVNPLLGVAAGALAMDNLSDIAKLTDDSSLGNAYADGALVGFGSGGFMASVPWRVSTAVGAGGFGYGATQGLIDGNGFDSVGNGLWSSMQALNVGNFQTPLSNGLGKLVGSASLPLARGALWGVDNFLTQDALNAGDIDGARLATTMLGGASMTPVGSAAKAAIGSGWPWKAELMAGFGGAGVSSAANSVAAGLSTLGQQTKDRPFMSLDFGNQVLDQVYPY